MDLFEPSPEERDDSAAPLAIRMRPRTPEEFLGQEHFFGPGRLLRRALKADRISSAIFYGPPGTGKTALAQVVASVTKAYFHRINASVSNVQEVREILLKARDRKRYERKKTVLFVDEIHRFNRAQQDILLPDVEDGTIILIGATTYNPFFAINAPLTSRSQIFRFEPLSREDIRTLLERALQDRERGLGNLRIRMAEEAKEHLAEMSDGDARRALNALEIGVLSAEPGPDGYINFDLALAVESIQRKALVYDGTGDEHYDAASAFIKSMRGSDPDAALYWMARMLEAGEDPRFIARRVVIFAAEDVGNADPQALVVSNAAFQAVEVVGMPEARIPLAQAVTYVATAPKSNASYAALEQATADVRDARTLEVPRHLRDSSYKGAQRLGHGDGYRYPHDYEGHWVDQTYVPAPKRYYKPSEQGFESVIKERLEAWEKRRREAKSKPK